MLELIVALGVLGLYAWVGHGIVMFFVNIVRGASGPCPKARRIAQLEQQLIDNHPRKWEL